MTILLTRLGHELAEVRPELAVVLGIVALVEQVHVNELVGVVAGDRVAPERREVELGLLGVLGGEAAPADVGRGGPCW